MDDLSKGSPALGLMRLVSRYPGARYLETVGASCSRYLAPRSPWWHLVGISQVENSETYSDSKLYFLSLGTRASKLNGPVETLRTQPLGPRPLLRSCLEGLARFSHLISVDFMADLLRVLQALAKDVKGSAGCEGTSRVWERLQCCTVAFKIVRINMDALNIDLREFYTLFYNLLIDAVIR